MLVTDHSKFGRNAMVNLGNMGLIDCLFTDKRPPESIIKIWTNNRCSSKSADYLCPCHRPVARLFSLCRNSSLFIWI